MKKNKEFIIFLGIGFLAVLAALFFPPGFSSGINDFPLRYIDVNHNLRQALQKSIKPVKVIAVALDENSIAKLSSAWPLPRSIFARVVESLDKEGVKAVGFDLVFKGRSQDPKEDTAFAQALQQLERVKVVLAYIFSPGKELFILPEPEFAKAPRCLLGLIESPIDKDGLSRRIYASVNTPGEAVIPYAFTVQLAAAYSDIPARDIVGALPVYTKEAKTLGLWRVETTTSLVNFVVKPGAAKRQATNGLAAGIPSVTEVSFYDLYANLDTLKERYGKNFLKDSLVLIYPSAEVLHDTIKTPLGVFPGGFLHINGFLNILSGKLMQEWDGLPILFMIAALAAFFFVVRYFGLLVNLLIAGATVTLAFWFGIALWLQGIAFNLAQIVIFCSFFFLAASLHKYLYSLVQLSEIKNKITLDPLRDIFTLRYFYYHFDLANKKFYFGKELYLFFISLGSFKAETHEMPLASIRLIWHQIHPLLHAKGSFWATYSAEEIAGGVFIAAKETASFAEALKNDLQALFGEKGLHVSVKIGYLRFRRDYSSRQVLFVLSGEMKDKNAALICFDSPEVIAAFKTAGGLIQQEQEFLQSIDSDIDEKNRELLEMIESLSKEQMRSKEVFFQVILSLVNALEARDPYTEGHSQRVTQYAMKTVEKLGWNKDEKEKLRKASLLHDLGKIGIPDGILHKKGKLTDEEFDFIKKHEIIAVKILEPIKDIGDILPWVLYHHERWDGKGYPHGLGGNAIPAASQVISLSDVYDALTTGRDYKQAMSPEDSLLEIERNKGTQFNPDLAGTFIEAMRELQAQK